MSEGIAANEAQNRQGETNTRTNKQNETADKQGPAGSTFSRRLNRETSYTNVDHDRNFNVSFTVHDAQQQRDLWHRAFFFSVPLSQGAAERHDEKHERGSRAQCCNRPG